MAEDKLEGYRSRVSHQEDMTEDELLLRMAEEKGPDSEDVQLFRRVQIGDHVRAFVEGKADPKTCAIVSSLVVKKADEELEFLEQEWSMSRDPASPEMRETHMRAYGLRTMLSWLDEALAQAREAEQELTANEENRHG